MVSTQLEKLSTLVSDNCRNHGIEIINKGEDSSLLFLLWLDFLKSTKSTGIADCLLEGASSAVREGISCLALGLVRPALSSFRLQIDLVLAWLFFKDHKVEWERVQETGDGYKLKGDVWKYLVDSHKHFNSRFSLLSDCKKRTTIDPYRLLSAHMHGQSELAIPHIKLAIDIVADFKTQEQALELQKECAEYINDLLWSIYADNWASLPSQLLDPITARFKSPAQRTIFFTPLKS